MRNVGSGAGAAATECERRPDDRLVPQFRAEFLRFFKRMNYQTARHFESAIYNSLFELPTVFRALDGGQLRADEFDAILLQHAAFRKLDSQI